MKPQVYLSPEFWAEEWDWGVEGGCSEANATFCICENVCFEGGHSFHFPLPHQLPEDTYLNEPGKRVEW